MKETGHYLVQRHIGVHNDLVGGFAHRSALGCEGAGTTGEGACGQRPGTAHDMAQGGHHHLDLLRSLAGRVGAGRKRLDIDPAGMTVRPAPNRPLGEKRKGKRTKWPAQPKNGLKYLLLLEL